MNLTRLRSYLLLIWKRLEQFIIANSIGQCSADASQEVLAATDDEKVAVFISVSFSQLCGKLKDHYKAKRLEIAETYRFHRCVQEERESVSAYSARLRRYAPTCNFGEFLNRSLHDQFICGIRNSATRKKLLNEDRTFHEVASKETLKVQNDTKPGDESVHWMGNSRNLLNQQNRKPSLPSF